MGKVHKAMVTGLSLRALPSVISGGVCLEPASCPCEWGGSFFPPGTVLQKDCGNWCVGGLRRSPVLWAGGAQHCG